MSRARRERHESALHAASIQFSIQLRFRDCFRRHRHTAWRRRALHKLLHIADRCGATGAEAAEAAAKAEQCEEEGEGEDSEEREQEGGQVGALHVSCKN